MVARVRSEGLALPLSQFEGAGQLPRALFAAEVLAGRGRVVASAKAEREGEDLTLDHLDSRAVSLSGTVLPEPARRGRFERWGVSGAIGAIFTTSPIPSVCWAAIPVGVEPERQDRTGGPSRGVRTPRAAGDTRLAARRYLALQRDRPRDRTGRFASIGSPEKGGGPNLIHMLEGTLEVQGR
jgi:hypothetical protein